MIVSVVSWKKESHMSQMKLFVICSTYPMEKWLEWFNHIYIQHTTKLTSKWFIHVTIIDENSIVVIKRADTDVLIIALGCISQIPPYINLWLEVEWYSKNTSNTLKWTSCMEKLVIQFILFLGRGKSAHLSTSKKMKLCKKYLVASCLYYIWKTKVKIG